MEIEGGVIVHDGYWNAFMKVKSRVTADPKPLIEEGDTLYITGHSMGGGMAMIATHEIARDSTGAYYTHGAPRVADYGFAERIKPRSIDC